MRGRLKAVAFVATAAVALSAAGGAGRAVARVEVGYFAWNPDGQSIVFGRFVGGSTQLVRMSPSGSDQKVIWEHRRGPDWDAGTPFHVAFSSDGERLAIASNFQLAALDGNGRTLRIWHGYWDFALAPGGQQLVAYAANLGSALVVLRVDDRATRLTRGVDLGPAWSPDGKTIVFMRDRGTANVHPDAGPYDLYAVAASGGRATRLARDAAEPFWSPNGDRLAFWRSRAYEIWSVRPNGALRRRLQRIPVWNPEPARWSRNGRRLLVLRPESPSARLLTRRYAFGMTFSPDGRRILFLTNGGGDCRKSGIWVLALASQRVKRLVGQC